MSYLSFYGLSREPFHITPDPDFLFLSPSHREALGTFLYGISKRKGILAVTGEVGVGKTTVLRSYLKKTNNSEEIKLIYIFNAGIPFPDLLRILCEELGEDPATTHVPELVERLQRLLIAEYGRGKNVVLIIDEAQNIPYETLENLRMLSNLETEKDKLLQIVLIGQPELEDRLNEHRLRQLKQRIAVRSTIVPLTESEGIEYIESRLARCRKGKSHTVFTDDALRLIVRAAGGIPRLINILCDNALITGYAYQEKPISKNVAQEVIKDFFGTGKRRSRLRMQIHQYRSVVSLGALLVVLLAALIWMLIPGDQASAALQGIGPLHPNVSVDKGNSTFTKTPDIQAPSFELSVTSTRKVSQATYRKKKQTPRTVEPVRKVHRAAQTVEPIFPRHETINQIQRSQATQELIALERSRRIQRMIQQNQSSAQLQPATPAEISEERFREEKPVNEPSRTPSPTVVSPAVLRTTKPVYPYHAIKRGVQGTVILKVLVTETGKVEAVQILRGVEGASSLSEAAAQAVQQWKFAPGIRNGERQKMWVTCAISFRLNS